MKQIILNEALQIIRQRRAENEKKSNANLKKALNDESFAKLYKEYTNGVIENAKCEAYNEKPSVNLKDIQVKLKERMKELNIDSIKAKPVCEKCEDTGLIDGKYCDCLKKEISKILLKNSGFEKLEKFENSKFDIFENQEEMKKVYEVMKLWCNKSDTTKNLVYLLGQTGTGKTHLLSCMANEFISQNKIVMLTTAFNLSQLFLKYHTTKDRDDILDDILSCEVLFIDDLGTEPFLNNITREYTYLVINERRMKNLKTIITSNLDPMELRDRYDERVFSRIMDKQTSIVLELKGCDKRLKK